ncbi:MAG: 4Fe-4S binding protein [Anaerolineae bacterium]|jgi:polyferredoxin|nr:4Fe-4S binding protein [Anaerolineae bacterium]MBT7191083.1 4Fe-4S binding protein [Anaerolineae bacterium]MBT7991397.1 4Fe-4S binding protein [Anaerolineae bacterium]
MAKKQNKERSSITKVRHTIQYIFLFATYLLGLRHIMPGRESTGGAFDAFCPMGGIETFIPYILTGQTLKTTNLLTFAVLIGVIGVSLLAGRAFCGWMCPIGTLQDMLAGWAQRLSGGGKHQIRGKRSKAKFPMELSPEVDKWARYLKYLVLLVVLIASVWTVYPPLRDICPARALFSFELGEPLLVSVLITFIITSLLIKRFWCKYLCPLGAFLAITNKFAPLRVTIDKNSCTGCARCEAECPVDIPAIPENMRNLECVQCLECVETCAVEDAVVLKLG